MLQQDRPGRRFRLLALSAALAAWALVAVGGSRGVHVPVGVAAPAFLELLVERIVWLA